MSFGGDTSNFQDQIIGHKINELSLNSGEFLTAGDALHMFSADEKQLMKDSTPNDFSHIHNCDSWNYISMNSVTPPSGYSGSDNNCFDNKDKHNGKKRISIGKYLSLRSEPLGCLEGDGKDGPFHEIIFGSRTIKQYSSNIDEVACKDIKAMEEKACSVDSSFSKEEGHSIDISDITEPAALPSFHQSMSHEYGRQLSAIAELSRENDSFQSSRPSEVRKGNIKPSTNFNHTNRSPSSSSPGNCNSPPMKLKNNKKPNDLGSVGRNDDLETDGRNSQSSYQHKDVLTCLEAKPKEFIFDWLEGTSEHFGIDDSRIKSWGSSKQCHSSTPIKSGVGRLSSPVSEIGPCSQEQMILSSTSSSVYEPACRESDISNHFSKNQINTNDCSLEIIDVVSELVFEKFCCVGISYNEILEITNSSNLLSSIKLSFEHLIINEEVKNLNDHRDVFSCENKIFLNKYAKDAVKIFFEPKSPGVYAARLVLKVNVLYGGGDGNMVLKRYVTIKAVAEQPVINISSPGTSSICQKLDFGIIPGHSSDIKKLLITNCCDVAIPINVKICHNDKSAGECFKVLFCVHQNGKVNEKSDCLLNELMNPGSQILVAIAFMGPDSTIGVKSIRCKMDVMLTNLKQDLLSSVELNVVTSLPRIGLSVDALVMTFDENTHRRVTKITNKGHIPLHLEMKSQSHLFSIEPDLIMLEPGELFDLAINYNQFLNNMEEDVIKSEVNFMVLPNGKNYKINVLAMNNANIQTRPENIPSNVVIDIDDWWHVTVKKCTLFIDLNDSPENLRKETKTFCISNCSNTNLRFKIMHPKTLSVLPSSADIQPRSTKSFTISPSDLYHLMNENIDLAVISISCDKSVKDITVNIKVIERIERIQEQCKENIPVKTLRENTQQLREEPKNLKMKEKKFESKHPLVTLSSSEKYFLIEPTKAGWDMAFESSELTFATLKLTSICDEDMFWHLTPISSQTFTSNILQTAQDVFTFDNYQGILHPRSSTKLTIFFKPPFLAKYCHVWKLSVESDVCFRNSQLKLVAEAQVNLPCNTTTSLDTEECELSYSTSVTSDTNSQIVKPYKYISNAATRLTSKDKKLHIIPEYLHFNASPFQVEVIEKIEVKNKLNEDTVLHVTKGPSHPFILEYTVFNLKAMHKIKIPVKCLAREAKSSWRDEVEFKSLKGDVFIVHLVLNLDA